MGRRKAPTQPDFIKWLLIAGVVALVVLFGWYMLRNYILPHSVTVDRFRYPVAGLDVSNHNGDIDFDLVAADNYQFVMIKASEGKTHKDEAFDRNYHKARAAGLKVGAYHFFRKNRTGLEQADNLLSVISGKTLDLPVVIDLEDDWGNGAAVDRNTTVQRVMEMVKCLKDKGYKVMIYTNLNGYNKYYKDILGDCDLWLCSFNSPDQMQHTGHRIQQYSHEGSVAGVDGDVDLNVFIGDKSQWQHYLDELQPQTDQQ